MPVAVAVGSFTTVTVPPDGEVTTVWTGLWLDGAGPVAVGSLAGAVVSDAV